MGCNCCEAEPTDPCGDDPGTVTIQVRGCNTGFGTTPIPITTATVTLYETADLGTPLDSEVTGADGNVTFSVPGAGSYTIVVTDSTWGNRTIVTTLGCGELGTQTRTIDLTATVSESEMDGTLSSIFLDNTLSGDGIELFWTGTAYTSDCQTATFTNLGSDLTCTGSGTPGDPYVCVTRDITVPIYYSATYGLVSGRLLLTLSYTVPRWGITGPGGTFGPCNATLRDKRIDPGGFTALSCPWDVTGDDGPGCDAGGGGACSGVSSCTGLATCMSGWCIENRSGGNFGRNCLPVGHTGPLDHTMSGSWGSPGDFNGWRVYE